MGKLLLVDHIRLSTKLYEDVETARWINAGLSAIASLQKADEITPGQARDLSRVADKILQSNADYEPITIHRYFPNKVLGGELGALSFGLDPIVRMIEDGEQTALTHDCKESGCLIE